MKARFYEIKQPEEEQEMNAPENDPRSGDESRTHFYESETERYCYETDFTSIAMAMAERLWTEHCGELGYITAELGLNLFDEHDSTVIVQGLEEAFLDEQTKAGVDLATAKRKAAEIDFFDYLGEVQMEFKGALQQLASKRGLAYYDFGEFPWTDEEHGFVQSAIAQWQRVRGLDPRDGIDPYDFDRWFSGTHRESRLFLWEDPKVVLTRNFPELDICRILYGDPSIDYSALSVGDA